MGVQVQSATKNGQGITLSILNRQFISFSYGGINIEDFDLLAVFSNDRLDKEIYAPFNDTTTEQAELDGQMFWRSSFKAGQQSFTLATDGMTARQLEDFKYWFQPGIERELILSENHNRAILARVASAPHISLLPFEKEVNIQIGETSYPTKTSLYKGEIKIDFVMDDPYWYSIESLYSENITPEISKVILEDGVPHLKMIHTDCFLAGEKYIQQNQILDLKEADTNIDLSEDAKYLYYCGTAPEKPFISFEISPEFDDKNRISFFKDGEQDKYYFLKIGDSKIEFSLPSLYSDYNKTLNILDKYKINDSILDLRKEIRDNTYNYYTRSLIINWIDTVRQNESFCSPAGVILQDLSQDFVNTVKENLSQKLTCSIDCQNGNVIISRVINEKTITENAGNMIKSKYLTIETRKKPNDSWQITSAECLSVNTNTKLDNLKINYKYKYL